MATLSGDVKVWSLREDVVVRDADFAAVRYQDKSNVSKERVYYDEKKLYVESRGGCVAPKNSRPTRLRDALKEFEQNVDQPQAPQEDTTSVSRGISAPRENISGHKLKELLSGEHVVWSSWGSQSSLPPPTEGSSDSVPQRDEPCRVYYLVLSSGVMCTALVSAVTGDLRALSSDKYMTGRLLSEHPAHAVITESHLVISYNDSRLSVLHMDPYTPPPVLPLSSPPAGGPSTPSIASRHPSLYTTQLAGPHGRRFQRRLTANVTGQMIAVWWERSEDEVYPWSPLERDCRDRANILIYSMRCGQLSLVGHARSHLPPLSVAFSARDANVVLSVEQGFDKKGGVTVLSVVYKIDSTAEKVSGRVERVSVTSIPLEAPVASHSYSPQEDRLFLACNNGVLALHSHASTHLTRAALSPTHVTWLQPGALLAVANDRGQVQFFDMALSLVRVQLGGEDGVPVRLLDFADYFCHQPLLRHISWAPAPVVFSCSDSKRSANANVKRYLDVREQHSSLLLMLHYSRGPLVCIRFNAPHFSLTHPVSNPRCDDLNSSSVTNQGDDSDPLNTSHVSYISSVSNSSNSSTAKSSTNVHNESLNVTGTSDGSLAVSENKTLTAHYCSISPDVLVGEYLCHGQVEEAINLTRSLCWEQDGGAALKCISNVVNYIIRRGQLSRRCGAEPSSSVATGCDVPSKLEDLSLQSTELGTNSSALELWESRVLSAASVLSAGFLSPSTPLTAATEELYGPPVRALARRLFFKLLRSGRLQPAHSLARHLGDPDCFVRLHRTALTSGLPQLAAEALQRAHSLRSSRSSSSSSSSSCSGSCSGSDWSGSSSSCCSEDCSHSSYSSGSSHSDTCSTCSHSSEGSDSDDLPEGRGERQGGDGRESEGAGNTRLNGAPGDADDVRNRPDRPLYIQQSTSFPPPVPAPILPRGSNSSPLHPADSSTITYYDPVPHSSSASHPAAPRGLLAQTPSAFSNSHGLFTGASSARAARESLGQSAGEKFVSGAKSSASMDNFSVIASDPKNPTSILNDRNLQPSEVPYEQTFTSEHPHVSSGSQFVTNQRTSAQNVQNIHEFRTSSRDLGPETWDPAAGVSNSSLPGMDASGAPATSPVSAITSQDGKVTINITQENSHKSSHRSSRHHKSKSKRSELLPASDNSLLENKGIVGGASSGGVETTQSKSVHYGSSKHRHHQKKPDPGGIPFRTRRSQRNLTDAMDAADTAIAALTSSRETKIRAVEFDEDVCSSFPGVKSSSGLPGQGLRDAAPSSTPSTDAPDVPHPGGYNGSQSQRASLEDGREQANYLLNPGAQDVGYYNEDTIDEELHRSMYQELSTEEEEGGGTVKVVHFGVV